ncbi:MAG: hypothetical protein KGH65_04935 [Candidatus Micrarchaeota archaeon]|nr:hypothetical protein [Candidatus Micrarchaeota archaeon]
MSVSAVHSAIVTYLQGASITHLNKVYQYPSSQMPETDFFPSGTYGNTTGAVIFAYMASGDENRIAVGGAHSGRKWIPYRVILNCFLRGYYPGTSGAGVMQDPVYLCAQDNEAFLDSLIAAIRADRNAGAAGTVFMWGEGASERMGGKDIVWEQDIPAALHGGRTAGVIEVHTRVEVYAIDNAMNT